MDVTAEEHNNTAKAQGYFCTSSDAAIFQAMLEKMIKESKNTPLAGGILLVDISNISVIMHINGRLFIDDMMERIVKKLQTIFASRITIFRNQINYLTIILTECSASEIQSYAKTIYQNIRAVSCELKENPIYISPLIGSVSFADDIRDANDALDKVYIALKNTTRHYNSQYYSSYQEATQNVQIQKNRMLLANCMEDALRSNKLRLAFQPIINSKTGAISHHECLLRIISPEGKLLSVGPFIPAAEEMGFISEIDELVLELVYQELKDSPEISLAFNISGMGISNPDWLQRAKILFRDPELASRAIVEITETAAQKDVIQSAHFITTLQDMGCQVALDDFGAGHTSFRQLKNLPVDIIKIDGSFIKDIVDNHNNQLFVKALLEISKGLGLKTIAEFVENGEIAKLLMELKVDYMQGNYFCPAVNYRSWVTEAVLD